jgi:hypothetical protein
MAETIFQASAETNFQISNAFDLTKKANLSLDVGYQKSWWGTLKGLWVYGSSAHASTTAMSIMITQDALGDRVLVPSTASAITFGLSSTTSGAAVWAIDLPFKLSTENVYVFIKTDHGTINVDEIVLSWERNQA